eukprot:TRINITY_DN4549_c1_g2_i1.p1 TRINITY_DN4549_c1_g2~~TRINITY_DN4549_c1_g2_i1.p1  ORF type:complete len:268 (+),score=69.63 TRINITY_DN4549_c1_g2_i1:22-804(+)
MLRGKLALITGATSGIGEATVGHFLKEGASVAAVGRNVKKLDELKALGCNIYQGDVAVEGVCERVVKEAGEELGGLDVLVNCAGVLKGAAFGTDACDVKNLMENFNTNTKGVFEMMQHSVPYMKAGYTQGRKPSIVNVSSVNGVQSFGGTASYCTSKAATEMLTKCAALDLAEHGIRVNAVNPGVVVTELQKRGGLDDVQYAAFLKRSVDVTHPLAKAEGRVATPLEVAYLIAFLASDQAAFITGESVRIDGGRGALGAR